MGVAYYSNDFPSFLDMFQALNPETAIGTFQIGGRLIPRTVVTEKTHAFRKALENITQYGTWISGLAFNVSKTPDVPNAAFKAWRKSLVSIVVGT